MLTLSLAKQHLEYEDTDRDALIQQYIDASKSWVEQYTGKGLAVGVVVQIERGLAGYIVLERGPVVSLTSIAYTDTDDDPQSVSGARLQGNRVHAPLAGWPAIAEYSSVTVTYQAGYSTTPADLVSAQLLLVGHWFANREAVSEGNMGEVPLSVEALCRPYRELMV